MRRTEQPEKKAKKAMIGVMAPVDDKQQVIELARLRRWTVSQAAAYLIKLGLERLSDVDSRDPARAGEPVSDMQR